jgi:hypothetical protein
MLTTKAIAKKTTRTKYPRKFSKRLKERRSTWNSIEKLPIICHAIKIYRSGKMNTVQIEQHFKIPPRTLKRYINKSKNPTSVLYIEECDSEKKCKPVCNSDINLPIVSDAIPAFEECDAILTFDECDSEKKHESVCNSDINSPIVRDAIITYRSGQMNTIEIEEKFNIPSGIFRQYVIQSRDPTSPIYIKETVYEYEMRMVDSISIIDVTSIPIVEKTTTATASKILYDFSNWFKDTDTEENQDYIIDV